MLFLDAIIVPMEEPVAPSADLVPLLIGLAVICVAALLIVRWRVSSRDCEKPEAAHDRKEE